MVPFDVVNGTLLQNSQVSEDLHAFGVHVRTVYLASPAPTLPRRVSAGQSSSFDQS